MSTSYTVKANQESDPIFDCGPGCEVTLTKTGTAWIEYDDSVNIGHQAARVYNWRKFVPRSDVMMQKAALRVVCTTGTATLTISDPIIEKMAPKRVWRSESAVGIDAEARYGFTNSSTADQTSKFSDLLADVVARKSSAPIWLPEYEIHITDVIALSEGVHFTIAGSTVESIFPPPLIGQGNGTRIYQETLRKSHFTYSGAGGLSLIYPRVENLRLIGPNPLIYMKQTTLSGTEAAGQSVLSVTSTTGVQVGDACLVILDSGWPWWAPVSAVDATTVTIGDGDTAWDLPSQAASGAKIFFWPYAPAIKFTKSYQLELNRLWFSDLFTMFVFDDVTGCELKNVTGVNVLFGYELGYNCDNIHGSQCTVSKASFGATGTCTNASAVITDIASTATIRVGQKISDITSLPILGFTENARVLSVDSATQITATEAYAMATGTKTLQCYQGVFLTNGAGAQPFKSSYGTGKYGSGDDIVFSANSGMLHGEALMVLNDSSTRNPEFDHMYVERMQRLVLADPPGATAGGIKTLKLAGKVSQSNYFTGPAIEHRAITAGDSWTEIGPLQDDSSAGTAIKFAWLKHNTEGFPKVWWHPGNALETDEAAVQSFTDANIVTGTDTITVTSTASFRTGQAVVFRVVGTAPTTNPANLLDDADACFVIVVSATTLKLATSAANAYAGTAIDITAAGTGTFYVQVASDRNVYFLADGATLVTGQEFRFNMGGDGTGASQRSVMGETGWIIRETLAGTYPAWNAYGKQAFVLTLAANSTIPNPTLGSSNGMPLDIIAIRNGGGDYTLALGANFIKADGTGVGTVTNNTSLVSGTLTMRFMVSGGKFILMSGQTPVFN